MQRKTPNPPPPPPEPLRVLLIEHDQGDVDLCLETLRRAGFDPVVHVVASKEELLQALRDTEFDVVISDFRLPKWTGMEALALLQQEGRDTPFLLVTGTVGDEAAVACIKRGVTDYVLKDRLARLPEAVRSALREKKLRQERARAVTSLRESEERYRTLVEHAPEAIVVLDTESGHFVDANENAVRLFGYPREQLLCRSSMDLSPPLQPGGLSSKSAASNWIQQALDGAAPSFEWVHRDASGREFPCEVRLVRLPSASRRLVRGSITDITDRRALEQQLRQAQKFEAIGQLVGGIAHDFNNVVGAVLGWAEMGMDEVPPDSRAHSYFKKTRAQADRAAALIRQLLAFARRQILEPRNLSINQSVADLTSMLESVLGKDIEIKTVLAPDLAIVRADPTQVEQVLLNLCINARDAMPGGGRLVIETENVDIDDEYCRRHAYSHPGRYVRLTVSDTGTGMDPATLEHIFEPFFTTKEPGRGTGLGLATAFGFVKQHGGFLHVYSELGHGSVFRIYFPAVEAKPDLVSKPEEEAARGGSETILLAENHEGLRETAHSTLEKLGYRVFPVPDGAAAVDLFRRKPDTIDLALLDVVMPHLNGPEAYALMEVLRPGLPVVFTSGYTAETQAFTDVVKRGIPFLPKPYSSSQLARKVREALDLRLAPTPSSSSSPSRPSPSSRRPR